MTQWTSTISSDALQRLSCGSEMFYSISCKLAVQESPNWQYEEALITQCWSWHLWDRSGHDSKDHQLLQERWYRLSLICSFHLTRAGLDQSTSLHTTLGATATNAAPTEKTSKQERVWSVLTWSFAVKGKYFERLDNHLNICSRNRTFYEFDTPIIWTNQLCNNSDNQNIEYF